MASDREEAEAKVKAAELAGADAMESIGRIRSDQERLEVAGQFSRGLRERSDELARIRQAAALAIYDAEKLSLARLAERVGISKQRADQIVKARRKEQDGEADAGADDGTG